MAANPVDPAFDAAKPELHDVKALWPTETVPYSQLMRWHESVTGTDSSRKKLPFKRWCEERARCRTDLMFLGAYVLGKMFTPQTHGPIAEFFVQKDFRKLPVNYTRRDVIRVVDEQSPVKWRMLHYPRGAYKSTMDVVDTLQWLLNCPNLRIMIVTGKASLAQEFVGELKRYCTRKEGARRTYFQQLFPEYCGTPQELGSSNTEFQCPAATLDRRENSVWAESIIANLSGFHCDIMKCDDVVTDQNSENEEQREKLNAKFLLATELLDPHGFLDIIGTRYSRDDLYGELLKKTKEEGAQEILYLKRPAWTPRPGFERVPLRDLKPNMVDLLFPEILTYGKLRQKLIRNERQFRCQQLNEPIESLHCDFNEEALREQTIPADCIPLNGKVFNVWDTANSVKNKSDFTVGVAGVVIEEEKIWKLYVSKIIHGRFRPTEKAYQIVKLAQETKPEVVAIENALGIENLGPEIQRIAYQYRLPLPLRFFEPANTTNAAGERIKGLEILLTNHRLYFSAAITCLEEMYGQFLKFVGIKTGKKDDIIDAISFLQKFLPGAPENEEFKEQDEKEQEEQRKKAMEAMAYAAIFGDAPEGLTFKTPQEYLDYLHRGATEKTEEEPEEEAKHWNFLPLS